MKAKHGSGRLINPVNSGRKKAGTERTANGTKAPVRAGNGATKSKEWYGRYD